MLISSYNHSFIIQAIIFKIVIYDRTVITIINYDRKTFIVQDTARCLGQM
jgi:hypothetical protein